MRADQMSWIMLHTSSMIGFDGSNTMLASLLILGGLTSVVLVTLSAVAFSRRRSRSYLLITFALGALSIKAFLGGVWMFQWIPTDQHHLLEHSMDLITAALLVAAVYYARTGSKERESNAEELRSQ